MKPQTPRADAGALRWARRVAWLVALWIAGVTALGLAAWMLKGVMRAVGLST